MKWSADNFDHAMPGWIKSVGGWLRDVVDFCYPGICPACRENGVGREDLCLDCGKQLDLLAAAPVCLLCGMSLAYRNAPCPFCTGRGVAHYEHIIRLGRFDEPIRPLIHHLKYHRAYPIGEMLADRLLQEDHVESLLTEADCLVPVPLHAARQLSRGFNQATIIAARLSAKSGIPLASPATRCRHTETQTHLHSRADRMKNLKDAFKLTDPAEIEGRRVVVVDDVYTTGATLQVFARVLKKAKPAALSALVVAVAEQKGRIQ